MEEGPTVLLAQLAEGDFWDGLLWLGSVAQVAPSTYVSNVAKTR